MFDQRTVPDLGMTVVDRGSNWTFGVGYWLGRAAAPLTSRV